MKLLRLVHTVNPKTGGPIAGIRAISPVLAAAGHTTDIVCFTAPPPEQATIAGVRAVYDFSPESSAGKGGRDVGAWLETHAADYDAAIAHGLWQPQTRLASRHLRGRVPYFVYPHGMLDPWFRRAYPLKHLKKWLYWLAVERHALGRAQAVMFTCEEERRLGRTTFWPYACRERVVRYGSATPPPPSPAAVAAFRARVPALGDRPYLLFLGRVHPKKGVDLLLEAYATLARETASASGATTPLGAASLPALVIAGPATPDAFHAQLRTLAAGVPAPGAVHWAGMLEGDAKWGALAGADAFVLPSHQENFGIAVVEALASGAPVLISEQINIWREIIADGAGIQAPDTAAGTLDLLRRWLALPATEKPGWRERAAACFHRRYEMSAVADSLVQTLSEELARTGRTPHTPQPA